MTQSYRGRKVSQLRPKISQTLAVSFLLYRKLRFHIKQKHSVGCTLARKEDVACGNRARRGVPRAEHIFIFKENGQEIFADVRPGRGYEKWLNVMLGKPV